MKTVIATREGLVGKATATGWVINSHMPFCALPSTKALYKFVRVSNPKTGASCLAIVMDVGPWNEHDDDYVFGDSQPQAESGTDSFGRLTNGAGIDLGEKVWKDLGMTDNGPVTWEFAGLKLE